MKTSAKVCQDIPPINSPLLLAMGIDDRMVLGRIQAKAPLLLAIGMAPIIKGRSERSRQQMVRASRVGRDPTGLVNHSDCGHSIRRDAAKTTAGKVLRDADVVIETIYDPDAPTLRISRGRRVDPLDILLRYNTIKKRQYDAVALLRDDIEAALPKTPGGGQCEVSASPWWRVGINDWQMKHRDAVRDALACVEPSHCAVLAWVLAGGTISAFAATARVRSTTVAEALRAALTELADYYFGREVAT